MEQFNDFLYQLSENKIFLIVLAIVLLLVIGLIFLSKTSFGKKLLKKQDNKIEEITNIVKDNTESIARHKKEVYEQVDKIEQGFDKVNELSDLRLTKLLDAYKNFKSDVFNVLDAIPNAKVKAQINALKEKYDDEKDIVEPFNADLYQLLNDEGDIKARLEKLEELLKVKDKVAENGCLTEEKEEHDNGEE